MQVYMNFLIDNMKPSVFFFQTSNFILLSLYLKEFLFLWADWNSLYINCGGDDFEESDILYEGDADVYGGAARFFSSDKDNWGLSSTGDFMDDNDFLNIHYISTRPSPKITALNTTARLSPLSLTYYGYCFENGNYTVSLHFLETQFTNDKTYSSLGRRIFDIYIQVSNHICIIYDYYENLHECLILHTAIL